MAEYKLSTKGSDFTRIEYDETEYDIVKLDSGEYIFSKNALVLKYPTSLTIENNSGRPVIAPVSFSSATRFINNKEKLLIEDIPNKFGSTYSSVVNTFINSNGFKVTSFRRVVDTSINCNYYGESLYPTNKKRNIEAYVYLKQDIISSVTCEEYYQSAESSSSSLRPNNNEIKKLYLVGHSDITSHPTYTLYTSYQDDVPGTDYVTKIIFTVSINDSEPKNIYGAYLTFYVSGFTTDHSDNNYTVKVGGNGFTDNPLPINKKYTVFNTGSGNFPIKFEFTADYKVNQNASLYIKVLPILVLPT